MRYCANTAGAGEECTAPRNSPVASVMSLCLAAPLGSRGEGGERLLVGVVSPSCSCSGFIQRFLWKREVQQYGIYSRTGKLATIVAFFHLGRKLGGLKLLNNWIRLLMKFIIDGGFVHWHCNPFPIRLYVFLIITSNSNETVEDRACIASLKGKDRGLLKSLKTLFFWGVQWSPLEFLTMFLF